MLLERGVKTCSEVENIHWSKNIDLEETLLPLWKLTCRGGILLDWINPPCNQRSCIIHFIYCLVVGIVFLFLLSVTTFELIQLIVGIRFMTTVHSIIPNLIWFTTLPLVLMTMLCYLVKRRSFVTFFEDWKELEKEIVKTQKICSSKTIHKTMYLAYFLNSIISLVSLVVDIYFYPDAPYLLSSYPIFVHYFTFPVLATIHILAVGYIWILFTMIDFVPSFVYYHQSLAINRLNGDCIDLFNLLKRFKKPRTALSK